MKDLIFIRLNPSNQSVEYLYVSFEKLVNDTEITVDCVNNICWDKIVQKNWVSNKEDPEMKKINFYERRKNYEERINTFISLSPYVEKSEVLSSYSILAKRIQIPDNTGFNYLELFNNFVKLLLRSVYREHEHGIQSEVKLKENYFITGLEIIGEP